jgi:NitT/TauT family transport system permease protein
MSRPPNSLLRLLLVLAVLAAWEGAVRLFDIPAYIVPAPSKVFVALYRGIASMLYIRHLWITLIETLLGFVVGSIVALVLGTLIALSRRCEYFLYPFILMFQAMPKVALAPLIIIWFGLGLTSKVAQASLTAFFPLMVNTIAGLRSADEDRVALMRSLDASEMQIFRMLRMPGAMPYIFAGFEIAMMLSLIGAIVAEFVGAQKGLGVLMMSMTFTMDTAGQFSVLLVLALVGLLLNSIIIVIRKRLLFWDRSQDRMSDAQVEGEVK